MTSKILAKYYSFFLCVNIFLPKVDLGFGQFYLFDFINVVLFILFVARGKLYLRSAIVLTYVGFILLCYITYLVGLTNFLFFDSVSFFRLIKFTVFILFLVIPYYIYKEFSYEDLQKILWFQVLFIVSSGLYTIYHMIFFPLGSANDYAWAYDNRYRLIGLTSYVIDLSGNITLGGSTSVAMGVFVAFIFFVLLSLYKFQRKKVYLFWAIVILGLEFITYSRAGILTLLTGILYFTLINLRPSVVIYIVTGVLVLVAVSYQLNLLDKVSTFGTLSKITNFSLETDSSIGTRVKMLKDGSEYIKEHPQTFFIGSGYGEDYTMAAIGHPHLEGLLPTTIVTSGIFGVFLLLAHFFSLWDAAKKYSLNVGSNFKPFLYAVRIFVPGWFLSASMAGNTFQTDFYFPLIYFIFFVSYFHTRQAPSPVSS